MDDLDRLAAELQAVRDELATAHEEIILSRQSEGDTMADLLATREERDKLRTELDSLRYAPVAVEVPVPTVEEWWNMVLKHDEMSESIGKFTAHKSGMRDTIEFMRDRIRTVDHSRILKDGEVAAPVKQWTIAQMLANAWSLHPLKCDERDALVTEWDAMRSSAQPTTNETRG